MHVHPSIKAGFWLSLFLLTLHFVAGLPAYAVLLTPFVLYVGRLLQIIFVALLILSRFGESYYHH